MPLNKQKYWQYVLEEIVDTGKRQMITDGFLVDFDPSCVNKELLQFRDLQNTNAPRNLKRILKRCNRIEGEYQFGRAFYDEDVGFGGFYLYKFPSGVKVQRKFLEYFKRLYPNCQFATNPKAKYNYCIAVRNNGKLIGGIAGVSELCKFIAPPIH